MQLQVRWIVAAGAAGGVLLGVPALAAPQSEPAGRVTGASAQATAAPGAAPVRTRHFHMVRDLRRSGGIWTGEVAIIRTTGRKAVGIQGALHSEFRCLVGTIRDGRLRGRYPAYRYAGDRIPAAPLDVAWVGSGSKQRMAGWRSVTAKRMKRISGGGVTKRLLRTC